MLEPWSLDWRQLQLDKLHSEWKGCTKCPELCEDRKKMVFGWGNPKADVMFIGTSPGEVEDELGRPFVGPSGQFLDAVIKGAGRSRDEFYFTNLLCCHPEDDRDPTKLEREACVARLYREIYLVDPYLVILVGKVAAVSLLGGKEQKTIEKLQGKLKILRIPGISFELEYDALPIYHPAHILREEHTGTDGKYPPNSKAEKTNTSIQRSFEVVDKLKREYEKFARRF